MDDLRACDHPTPSMDLETLSQWFLQSLSPAAEPRRAAESSLSAAADLAGFPIALLRLVADSSTDQQICLAAAIYFKNLVRSRWSTPLSDHPAIPPPEKDQVKSLLLPLVLSSPSRLVQSQLSESLSLVASHDFPQSWPSLLPDIVSTLRSSTDCSAINGLLAAANSIFLKFRHSFDTPALHLDLKYCLDIFAAPLLEIFLKTSSLISTTILGKGPVKFLRAAKFLHGQFESQRLCGELFLSLRVMDTPEFFDDRMREWTSKSLVYLTTVYPPALKADGSADALLVAVCKNLHFYMEKNQEEFKDYIKDFGSAVWSLLISPATSPFGDQLTITAIRFLTKVSTSEHHSLFSWSQALLEIFQRIVFPNVLLRDEDEELFYMNYVEYIRRDIEGSDIDTRRRMAFELLKGIALNYKEQVTAQVSMQIQNILALYAVNPAKHWKKKEAAIYLVVSLATEGSTSQVVDVDSFFATAIVPELQGEDVNASPMLKAGALKFFTTFREQLPICRPLLPHVSRFVTAESNVVHSYAANCIEKLLLVKDYALIARYGRFASDPWLLCLPTNLLDALQFPDSQENQYVMKCIIRVLGLVTRISEHIGVCMDRLSCVAHEVSHNPKDPVFNQYLFEAIGALVARCSAEDIPFFESYLLPLIYCILKNDNSQFWPYAFRMFSQVLEAIEPPLPDFWLTFIEALFSLKSFESPMDSNERGWFIIAIWRKMPWCVRFEHLVAPGSEIREEDSPSLDAFYRWHPFRF